MSARVPGGVWVVPSQIEPVQRVDGSFEYQLSDGTTVVANYVPVFKGTIWAWQASVESDGYHGHGEAPEAAIADLLQHRDEWS